MISLSPLSILEITDWILVDDSESLLLIFEDTLNSEKTQLGFETILLLTDDIFESSLNLLEGEVILDFLLTLSIMELLDNNPA